MYRYSFEKRNVKDNDPTEFIIIIIIIIIIKNNNIGNIKVSYILIFKLFERILLESIYIYFPSSSHLTVVVSVL